MLLNEFFGKAIAVNKKIDTKRDDADHLLNNLFYYIIDHDKLYKEYFLPVAKKIIKNEGLSKEQCVVEFMPMVKKGCLEFYKHKKMKGSVGKLFPKNLREELCEKLHDHYREGIVKKEYQI